ncbi:hypothetical protein DENSPDRAFT_424375 [Dentipellis sp. KUC8613]|nr:hypothetical protein DENSPDRAFT_424375 [Dentipellis sp. KUC8613]
MEDQIKRELQESTFIADTDNFLSNILPVPSGQVDIIYDLCTQEQIPDYYNGRWTRFLASPKKEKELYDPIVAVANSILAKCRQPNGITLKVDDAYWKARPDESPSSRDEFTALIRPDLVAVLSKHLDEEAESKYNEEVKALEERLSKALENAEQAAKVIKNIMKNKDDPPTTGAFAPTTKLDVTLDHGQEPRIAWREAAGHALENSQTEEASQLLEEAKEVQQQAERALSQSSSDLKEKLRVWWLRVHVPVEVKLKDSEQDIIQGIKQLCRYMRQVLAEQLDRRFVIGLLICGSKLSIWLCDRSGLMGTRNPIDIHKEPKRFIQTIMAISCLEPSRLGWDPTMKVVCDSDKVARYSTDKDLKIEDYGPTIYDTRWAIFVPKEDGSTEGEWYLTVRALSIVRAAMMSGRATLVWIVVKEGCAPDAVPQRLVLKQAWRPEETPTEGQFVAHLESHEQIESSAHLDSSLFPNICDIERSVCMSISDDASTLKIVDDTRDAIRRGVMGESFAVHQAIPSGSTRLESEGGNANSTNTSAQDSANSAMKRKRDDEANLSEKTLHTPMITSKTRSVAQPAVSHFTNRILTRTLMKTYGWPLKFFKDLPELVKCIRDAVEGHRYLWYGGVLHRDISAGNILICPNDDNPMACSGRLIDLDYAKMTSERVTIAAPMPSMDEHIWDSATVFKITRKNVSLSEDAVEALAYYFKDINKAGLYLDEILKAYPDLRLSRHELSREDIHMPCPPLGRSIPPWIDREALTRRRTGTKAFMSYEILSDQPYNKFDPDGPAFVVHNALHDLESFFWVLLYLCLTRKGPGGARRDDLLDDENFNKDLYAIVYCLFDADDDAVLNANKKKLFTKFEHMKQIVIPQLHPYFEGLSDLVAEWWTIIWLAHQCDSRHTMVQATIHEQIFAILDKALESIHNTRYDDPEVKKLTDKEIARREKDLKDILKISQEITGPFPPAPARTPPSTPSPVERQTSSPWQSFSPSAKTKAASTTYHTSAEASSPTQSSTALPSQLSPTRPATKRPKTGGTSSRTNP